jgi:lipopolysaccharide transport system ATP-binding protein
MSDVVISVENLSKCYLLGHQSAQRERHATLRDVIAREARNLVRNATDFFQGRQIVQGDEVEIFWALRNLNFEVKAGEVVGIIGRNGAGKSTLLKILSRITEPTEGRVILRGRLASLLEVGTGFHAELTGRENIFLNGAILGMTQREIRKKFDEVVAFAEVEKFLDTPVKRYSSGMYVRLAFAVAAHLEPEILVVDEVLAVGDAEFQKKCLGKMGDLSRREGRTVLFVSHNIAAVGELTRRALLLEDGRIVANGRTSDVISAYLSKDSHKAFYDRTEDQSTRAPHIARAEVVTSQRNGIHQLGREMEIKFLIRHFIPMKAGCFSFQIVNQLQQAVVYAWAFHPDVQFGNQSGQSLLTCRFPSLRLNVGQFYLRANLSEPPSDGRVYERLDGVCFFEVAQAEQALLWGWHAEDCAYHERWDWTMESVDA